MLNPYHKKIAIVGNAGSGKTVLSFQLQKQLFLPLYHLDQYYWRPDWQRIEIETFNTVHEDLCKKDEWIIEGSYVKLLHQRVSYADIVIFLDMPRHLCMWRVVKRTVLNFGKVIPGSSEKCKQRIFSFKFLNFLKWVWNFNNRYRHMILDILDDDEFKAKKHILILRSPREVALFVKQLESNLN